MPHIHDHHTATATAPLSGQPDQASPRLSGHPPWCSPQHCFLDEDGVQVHEQEPVRWEECEVRFESRLLFPDGEHPPTTYLQLRIEDLRLTWHGIDAFLSIATAQRLRDLAAVRRCSSVPSRHRARCQRKITVMGSSGPTSAPTGDRR